MQLNNSYFVGTQQTQKELKLQFCDFKWAKTAVCKSYNNIHLKPIYIRSLHILPQCIHTSIKGNLAQWQLVSSHVLKHHIEKSNKVLQQ